MDYRYDSAKTKIIEDELGYSLLAYYLASAIKNASPKKGSYVVGINGKWGDGKTSLINFTKEILEYSYAEDVDLSMRSCNEVLKEIESYKWDKLDKCCSEKLSIIPLVITVIIALLLISYGGYNYTYDFEKIIVFLGIVIILFTIPRVRKFLINIFFRLFYYIKGLFIVKIKDDKQFEVIDFTPWNYQDGDRIVEKFFMLLADKIDIIDDKTKINLFLQYLACIINTKLPSLDCCSDINDMKELIYAKLENSNKKYLVVLDDIDRISDKSELMSIFKMVKLLGDFPNIIYLLAYDKENLSKICDIQDMDYLKKIVQLEKSVPVLSKAKLKEIFITKISKITSAVEGHNNKERLINAFDTALYKILQNVRDINRFVSFFELVFASHENYADIDLVDLIVFSAIEFFDEALYRNIYFNKETILGSISEVALTKHVNFISAANKSVCFELVDFLLASYFSNVDTALTSILSKAQMSTYSGDVSINEIENCQKIVRFAYAKYYQSDSYRRLCEKECFDSYFSSTIVSPAIVSDKDYRKLISTLSNVKNFKRTFVDVLAVNEDRFSDFIARVCKDGDFISNKKKVLELFSALLSIDDVILMPIFEKKDYFDKVLKWIYATNLITFSAFANVIEQKITSSNVIQCLFWYHELNLAPTKQYFKFDRFESMNLDLLKDKLTKADLSKDVNIIANATLTQRVLKVLGLYDIRPPYLTSLLGGVLKDEDLLLAVLLELKSNRVDYKKFFEFDKIRDKLITYYLRISKQGIGSDYLYRDIVEPYLKDGLKKEIADVESIFSSSIRYSSVWLPSMTSVLSKKEALLDKSSSNYKRLQVLKTEFLSRNIFSSVLNVSKDALVLAYLAMKIVSNARFQSDLNKLRDKQVEIFTNLSEFCTVEENNKLKQEIKSFEDIFNIAPMKL